MLLKRRLAQNGEYLAQVVRAKLLLRYYTIQEDISRHLEIGSHASPGAIQRF